MNERRPTATTSELRRPLVVVADDDFDIRAIVKRVLEQRGYGVVAVENGEQAWEAIQQLHPDIALLDGLMPKADGRVVARRVKDDRSLTTKCVLLTSLYTSVAQKSEAFRLFGIDAHLSKPVSPELLDETLKRLLSECA
ncbi:MAG: response regulator [Thermoanaerobaculia bacterium]